MAKTILVTGAHGFVGRHVARILANNGCRVIGLGHGQWNTAQLDKWGLSEWYAADVEPESLIEHVGVLHGVIHCAGSGSVGFSLENPYEDYGRTVDTIASMLEYLRVHAPDAPLVYPSSAAVYGNVQRLPISESDPIAPVSPYGVHKHMAEEMCASYARNFGLKVAIVRLFSVYGMGLRKQLMWDACSRICNGDSHFAGTGAEQRDWLYVEDAAHLLALMLDNATDACPVINGGSGVGVTVSSILEEIAHAFGKSTTVRFSGQARPADPVALVADISRARRLGWGPIKSWKEAVREYVDWYSAGAH